MRSSRSCCTLSAVLCYFFFILAAPAFAQGDCPEPGDYPAEFFETLDAVHVHGVTCDDAAIFRSSEGEQFLIDMLTCTNNPSRGNTVAYLGLSGSENAVKALVSFLENPPANTLTAEDDRAALITANALGDLARGCKGAKGLRSALKELRAFTRDHAAGTSKLRKGASKRAAKSHFTTER